MTLQSPARRCETSCHSVVNLQRFARAAHFADEKTFHQGMDRLGLRKPRTSWGLGDAERISLKAFESAASCQFRHPGKSRQ